MADRIILMSGCPGRILKDIAVTIPRVRERSNSLYGGLTAELLALLEEA